MPRQWEGLQLQTCSHDNGLNRRALSILSNCILTKIDVAQKPGDNVCLVCLHAPETYVFNET